MAKTITLPDKPKAINLPRVTRELVQCQMCGYCIDVCEAHRQTPWESVTARGKIYYLNQLDKAGFGLMDKVLGRKVKISPEFVDAIYKCTGCGNCEEICHAKIELVKLWENVRTWLVQQGVAPLPVHKGIAQKIAKTGNSFGEPRSKRDAWWPKEVERAEAPDVLMFAGCTGSYRMQHIPAAGATILSRAGVRINCMGEDEVCCTSPLLRTGIRDLTLDISREIVTKADAMGAKDMVMTCAGCYKTISSNIGNYYSKTGQNVYHFTQYVDKLIKERKLPLNNEFKAKVTYHDPCHLGRHSKVYEEPRNILKKIKGIEFVEMERNRENSRCCGAGGGYKSAFNDFAVNIAMERIHDAEAVGAEVIATACPFCVLNLKAGAKKAGSSIKVMDISEILLQVTAPKVEEPVAEPAATETPAVTGIASAEAEAALAEAMAAKAAAEAALAEAIAAKEKAEADKAAAEEEKAATEAALKEAQEAKEAAEKKVAEAEAAKAYDYAREKNAKNVEEGKYDQKRADAFEAQIAEVEASEADDAAKKVALAQVIGGMMLAGMALANSQKEEEKPAEEAPAEEAAAGEIEGFEESGDEEFDDFDEWALTPEGKVRRAAWNKGLRCRREYGPFKIPVAFVKGKVAVYVGTDAEEHRAELEKKGWVVLSYTEEEVTDGQAQAEEMKDVVKSQLRAMKKSKKKKKA